MSPPPAHSYDALDTLPLRQALGEFTTGITVVTARSAPRQNEELAGITVNSFASVSLDPPLVLWSIGLGASSFKVFERCEHFAVNVLAIDQTDYSRRFAQPGADKFADIDWRPGLGGSALLPGCCAWFECRTEARYEGGDHLILIGRVEQFRRAERPPLVFHRGAYTALVNSAR